MYRHRSNATRPRVVAVAVFAALALHAESARGGPIIPDTHWTTCPGECAPSPPPSPSVQDQQSHFFSAATGGLDFEHAHTAPGIWEKGERARIGVVDTSFQLYHEDFQCADLISVERVPIARCTNRLPGDDCDSCLPDSVCFDCAGSHGNRILAQIAAGDNGFGITGGAPDATIIIASSGQAPGCSADCFDVVMQRYLRQAINNLGAGDVLLLESSDDQAPGIEMIADRAAELGIHFVLPSGNANVELTDPSLFDRRLILAGGGAFDRAASEYRRACAAAYGHRVDAFAPLYDYWTVCETERDYSCGPITFGGTSSTSAIVTAAVGVIESRHEAVHGAPQPVDAMRLFLRTSGSPSACPVTDRVGRQPDMATQFPLLEAGANPAHVLTVDYGFHGRPPAVAVGELDGDGWADVVVGTPATSGTPGAPTSTTASPARSASCARVPTTTTRPSTGTPIRPRSRPA